ncbi:MAG: hypothetical protein Q8903_13960 [Bacteroidota bacterium]|nr:hypothetical protein [Bacteroidota bacterium]
MKLLLFILFAVTLNMYCQYDGNKFSISVNGVYTTSSKIYLHPDSPDETIRNNSFETGSFYNPAVEIRYRPFENVILGLNIDYISKEAAGSYITVYSGIRTVSIEVKDGFKVIPVELSVYYLMPFSTESFKMYFGGGAGYYFGSQIRKFGDADISTTSRKFAYGIQALVGTDFMLFNNISIRGEMKFRDPQFKVTSRYNKTSIKYNSTVVTLPYNSFDSKINIDGLSFILGLAYHF